MQDLVYGNTYAFEQTCKLGFFYDCEGTHFGLMAMSADG
jgi:hypothetical protein